MFGNFAMIQLRVFAMIQLRVFASLPVVLIVWLLTSMDLFSVFADWSGFLLLLVFGLFAG